MSLVDTIRLAYKHFLLFSKVCHKKVSEKKKPDLSAP